MQNNLHTSYSISDLENLSGIKAHTIRIWEKRYELLQPKRSNTNIRSYDTDNLLRLLNATFLNNRGLKVSKIAKLSNNEMTLKINEFTSEHEKGRAHNMFIMAMLQFDEQLFNETYKQLTANSTFREIFTGVFLSLLEEIGLLWQTGTITIAHEHFISSLIKQKVLINIEQAQTINKTSDKTYALFLPDHEIHELGILFIYFELKIRGYHIVYLGQSVPTACLLSLQEKYNNIEYISQFTVAPSTNEVDSYLASFSEEILKKRNEKLHIVGRNTSEIKNTDPNVVTYDHITNLIDSIN